MNSVHRKEQEVLRTWIDIDTKAAAANLRALKKMTGKSSKILAVVKSNAYGHGLVEWSQLMERLHIDWLGVDSLVEGLALRRAGVRTPILVLGYTLPSLLVEAQQSHIAITVSDREQWKAINALPSSRNPLHVHLKVDTGMHRQGFQLRELPEVLLKLLELEHGKHMILEGMYTHFAKAKDPHDRDALHRQYHEMERWRDKLAEHKLRPIVHAGATGGALLFPQTRYDMVRLGIGLYGHWPSKETRRHLERTLHLKPVLSWRAMVSEVKQVGKGERIGYDLTELLTRDSVIAIVPIGYWHGYPRALSGKGRVLIHGKNARVLGRVSMNMIVVDVTDIPRVHVGDRVTLIGKDRGNAIEAEELAQLSGTTHYELLTRLNPLIKKFYL